VPPAPASFSVRVPNTIRWYAFLLAGEGGSADGPLWPWRAPRSQRPSSSRQRPSSSRQRPSLRGSRGIGSGCVDVAVVAVTAAHVGFVMVVRIQRDGAVTGQ